MDLKIRSGYCLINGDGESLYGLAKALRSQRNCYAISKKKEKKGEKSRIDDKVISSV